MKQRVLIAAFLVAAWPAAAQVSTSLNRQGLSSGQTGELAATQATPTTGVSCVEEMTATFCNAPTGPNTGGYGGGGSGAAAGGSGAASGLSAGGSTAGNASSLPPCPGEPPFNELCN